MSCYGIVASMCVMVCFTVVVCYRRVEYGVSQQGWIIIYIVLVLVYQPVLVLVHQLWVPGLLLFHWSGLVVYL